MNKDTRQWQPIETAPRDFVTVMNKTCATPEICTDHCHEFYDAVGATTTRLHVPEVGFGNMEPVGWLYPEGLEALRSGRPWTTYGTKQDNVNIPIYLYGTVAPRVEPPAMESGAGFESLPVPQLTSVNGCVGTHSVHSCGHAVDDAEDAARYRWLADYFTGNSNEYDDAIVAAKTRQEMNGVIDDARNQGEMK